MNWELCNLCALFYELILVVEELVEVVWIFWLACHCCEGLVSNYGLLLGILYALSNEVLMASASDLAEDKTDLVLE